jgi:cation transport ATPase
MFKGGASLRLLSATAFVLTFTATTLRGEFLRIEQAVGGLDCVSCAQSVDKTLKKIKGVEAASFRTEDAVAVLDLKPGNRVALDEIRDAVKRIGYTPKEAKVTVRGQARMEAGKWLFRVAGSDAEYSLNGSAGAIADQLRQSAGGAAIVVEGSIAPERAAPIRVSSVRRGE